MRNKLKKIVGTLLTFALAFTIIGGEAKSVNAATSVNVRWIGREAVTKIGESKYVGYIVLDKEMIDDLIDAGADFGKKYFLLETGSTGNGMTVDYADKVIAATGLNNGEVYLLPLEQEGKSSLAKSGDAGTIVNTAIIGVLLAVKKTSEPKWYFNYYNNDEKAIDFGNEAQGTLNLTLKKPTVEIKDLPEVEYITIAGTKTWIGNGVKPDSITVNLLQDTKVFRSQVVKSVDGVWSYEFENVPKTDENWNEHVYTIKEIEVSGFVTTYNGFNIINTTIVTPAIKGTIEFLKHDGERRVLEGATFNLYDAEDVTFETVIATAKSDTNGMVKFTDVAEGNYKIKESIAPVGYIKSEIVLEAAIVVDKATVTPLGGPVVNTPIKADIVVTKVDDNEKVLPGAEFTLYQNDVKVGESVVTNMDGKATFKDIPYGTYTVKETKAPVGYVKSEDDKEIKIEDTDVVEVEFENMQISGTVEITKVDKDDNEKVLPGALFKIVDKDGKEVYRGTTDENGMIVKVLPYGVYTLSEVEPPKDYEKTEVTKEINIVEHDKVVKIQFENEMIEIIDVDPLPVEDEVGTLKIKKVDKETGAALAGVKFRITDKDGDVVFEGLTDVNGMIEEELLVGDYMVTELETLPEYVISTKSETAKIKTDGEVVELTISNKKMYGLLSIKKVDAETGDVLEGAKFRIVDRDGKEILEDVTDEEGMLELWLPKGEYIISETEAPEDYIATDETWSVKVKEDGQVFNLVVENEMFEIEEVSPETLPQTGGIPSKSLYILGAFAIFTGLQLTRKRRTV